jgi:hypothetical protein
VDLLLVCLLRRRRSAAVSANVGAAGAGFGAALRPWQVNLVLDSSSVASLTLFGGAVGGGELRHSARSERISFPIFGVLLLWL